MGRWWWLAILLSRSRSSLCPAKRGTLLRAPEDEVDEGAVGGAGVVLVL